ncbi:MAG: glycosyltransferase, partial [Anaerolineae bacterium]
TISVPTSEGYGASVYEALACGCPTVISDLPIFREDLEDCLHVLKVPVGCPGAVAEAIQTLHSQPDLYTSLVSKGLKYAQGLGEANRISQSKRLYEELLNC